MWKKSEPQASETQSVPVPQVQPISAQRNPTPQPKERSVIGPTISIKGDLRGEEDLLIEGRVEGKVEFQQHSVTVGKDGQIKADIRGKAITVEGNVEGNLFGEEQLIVRQTGTVRGNIVSPRVVLEDGSNFKGNIDMSPKEKGVTMFAQDRSSISDDSP